MITNTIDAAGRHGRWVWVPRFRREPLPRGLVEDLVAIARMLYRSWRAAKAPAHQLRALTAIGKQLCEALELARLPVATPEHARAWALAEEATEQLGRIVGSDLRVISLLTAAFAQLDRPERPSIFQEREHEKLHARRQRS